MVSQERAKELLKEAKEFANWDPDRQLQDFFLAKEKFVAEGEEEGGSVDGEEQLVVQELPLHDNINTELNALFMEELSRIVSKVAQDQKVPLDEYEAKNIERDPRPIQYLPIDEIPDEKVFDPFTRDSGIDETSVEEFESADFQAMRVRDSDTTFVAIRKFTRRQIVGSSWKVTLHLEENEYDRFEDELFALPENIDAFVYKDVLFVVNQRKFEDIFNYFESYKKKANTVFDGIESSELMIHNQDEFEQAVLGDRTALRKMVRIENRALYEHEEFDQGNIETLIDDYNLGIISKEKDGGWGIVMPNKGNKTDILRLLNDDHLLSDITAEKYQARSKREI